MNRRSPGTGLAIGLTLTLSGLVVACSGSDDGNGAAGAGMGGGGLASGGAAAGNAAPTSGASGTSTGGVAGGGSGANTGGAAGAASGASGANTGGGAGAASGASGAPTAGTGAGGAAGTSAGGTTGSAGSAGMNAGSAGMSTAGTGGAAQQPYKGVGNSPCADLGMLKVSWWYNWTLDRGNCSTAEFVPMISGKSHRTPEAVSGAITNLYNAGYRTVLGFNEPNKADQANFPMVSQVLSLWPAMTSNPAIRVGSPATSGDAQAWFTDFMTQATSRGLRNDFLAIHWYGWNAGSCDANAREFERYITWAENIPGNKPIWITEFGCLNLSAPDAGTVERFFTGALAMLARHPRVERYAWYPWAANHALVANGALTPLGTVFANAPAFR